MNNINLAPYLRPTDIIDSHHPHIKAYNLVDQRFMEYVDDHGVYADIPVKTIVTAWQAVYGRERVQKWIRLFEANEHFRRDFDTETVVDQ